MSAENGLSRVVLTLKDETRRIRGPECRAVQADAESGLARLTVGLNGDTRIEHYAEVQHVLVEGFVDRVLIATTFGDLGLEYPRRLVVAEFSLVEGCLRLATDGKNRTEQDIKILGINRY